MKQNEMDKFIAHCNKYLDQDLESILHTPINLIPHIDILLYKPTEKHPYWKLITMGASDYQMPNVPNTLGYRNEYIIFISPSEEMTDPNVINWYCNQLFEIAYYPVNTKCHITYGHSIEWGNDENSDMVSAFIEMPQIIEDVNFLKCKLGLLKHTIILQPIFLTRDETNTLLKIGPQAYSDYLYPENNDRKHFICERYRTELF